MSRLAERHQAVSLSSASPAFAKLFTLRGETDAAIAEAQARLWHGLRQWVEPGGACALAALLSGAYVPAKGEKVAVLVCGANPAPSPF